MININFGRECNDKDSKFNVGDHVRISKYKNIFTIGYSPNWSGEGFVLKRLKMQCHGHTSLMILMMKKLLKYFMKKNCKKQIKNNLR